MARWRGGYDRNSPRASTCATHVVRRSSDGGESKNLIRRRAPLKPILYTRCGNFRGVFGPGHAGIFGTCSRHAAGGISHAAGKFWRGWRSNTRRRLSSYKSRNRLAPVLTEASSWTSDRSAQDHGCRLNRFDATHILKSGRERSDQLPGRPGSR